MAAVLAELFIPTGDKRCPKKRAALVLLAEACVNLRCVGALSRGLLKAE